MKNTLVFTILCFLALLLIVPDSTADVDIGLSVGEEGIRDFHLSISNHYNVRESNIVKIKERSIPDNELIVVFFLAKRASVSPSVVVDLRLNGNSWLDITTKLGLKSDIYYIKFEKDPGPPYGKAYGHYKNKPKNKHDKINLVDDDIINIVNLKFLTERYNCTPEEVVKLRKQSKSFVAINSNLKKAKNNKNFANKSNQEKESIHKDNGNKGKSKNKK